MVYRSQIRPVKVNISIHETTGNSPFATTFGHEPTVGLRSTGLPEEIIQQIQTEEDLDSLFDENEDERTASTAIASSSLVATSPLATTADSCSIDDLLEDPVFGDAQGPSSSRICPVCSGIVDVERTCHTCSLFCHKDCSKQNPDGVECYRCEIQRTRKRSWPMADREQQQQAEKMLKQSKNAVRPLTVGQNASIRVPEVDRGLTDARYLIVVVTEALEGDKESLYRVGCKEGILNRCYSAADLDPLSHVFIAPDQVPDKELALRSATAKMTGGQGY